MMNEELFSINASQLVTGIWSRVAEIAAKFATEGSPVGRQHPFSIFAAKTREQFAIFAHFAA
jgi:hypothetical protein